MFCNKLITKNEKVVIIAQHVKLSSDNGDYDLISDFLDKEEMAHQSCFNRFKKTRREPKPIQPADNFARAADGLASVHIAKAAEILKGLGISPDRPQLIKIFVENNLQNEKELVKHYFRTRSGVSNA